MREMAEIKVTLVTGRTADQGASLEIGKTSGEYLKNVALIELSKKDAEELGLSEGDHVNVKTDYGSTVVKCRLSEKLDPGLAFMPYGPWANQVIGSETQGTGMPYYKGLQASISLAKDASVLSIEELANRLMGI